MAGSLMTSHSDSRKRRAEIAHRVASPKQDFFEKCTVMGCGRPTRRAAGTGLNGNFCTYHGQRKARFGSPVAPAIRATELSPYVKTALAWIRQHRADPILSLVLLSLRGLLDGAGPVDPVMNLKRRSAKYRAKVAFARLREAGVKPERLLAIHLGVAALVEDDADSHRICEFRIVQTAKAMHRLASGTHRRWDFPLPNGTIAPAEMHVYPKSSGRVLRVMGEAAEEICDLITSRERDTIRRLKREKHGPHPSQVPGWQPAWRRKLAAARGL
ncbi:hypothetical protein BHAOGJBA_0173 [Methylobacterium hispanicum]|uniref:Uncharacterized protein n=1 Tax=Methylobacterium hispanicum TaxID=270350 RepID=A0AAV4ZEE9_9HYPH|nr:MULTISPECIES: hypothetical protein [Methylobacterium]GJD86678.1 hypothetical protein BHAOGJBA_0173 [Methylobacterium hispanicum]